MPTTVSGCGNAGWPMRVCYTVTWWSTIEENCLATTTSSSASTCYKRWSNVSSTNCERREGQPSTGTTTIITPTLLTMRRAPMSANGPDATPTPSTMRTKTSTDNSAERNAYASCQHQRRTCKLAIFLHGYGRTNATRTESERRWYSATNTCFPPSSIVSPSEVEMVNVTTGYPLQQTPIASFLTQLIALQTDGFSLKESRYKLAFIERVLRHPYAKFVSPLATDLLARLIAAKRFYISREDLSEDEGLHLIFLELPNGPLGEVDALQLTEWLAEVTRSVAMGGPNGKAPLFQESVFRMFTTLQQLAKLIADGDLDADLTILRRLITQLVGATSVPFHGEPARGVRGDGCTGDAQPRLRPCAHPLVQRREYAQGELMMHRSYPTRCVQPTD